MTLIETKSADHDATSSLAAYLTHHIELSGKTQKQIAEEVGFDKPNMITMIKQGTTKLPMLRIHAFAVALGIDPINLLRRALNEYNPEILAALQEILPQGLLTKNERNIIQIVQSSGRDDPAISTPEDRTALELLIKRLPS